MAHYNPYDTPVLGHTGSSSGAFSPISGRETTARTRPRFILYGRDGWPVEFVKGRIVTNIFRALIHTSILQTWRKLASGVGSHVDAACED